jgi:hypothetical protein
MPQSSVIQYIRKNVKDQAQFTTQELIDLLNQLNPDATRSTHSWRINQLKSSGQIHQIGRGIYSFISKPEYTPALSLKSKRLFNRVQELAPELEIVVWETTMLAEIMELTIEKQFIFFHTKRDRIDFLYSKMLDFSKPVFPNPNKEVIETYLLPLNEAIVLLPLSTQTPVMMVNDFKTKTIEGLLVSACLVEGILAPLGIDLNLLFTVAFSKFNVNESRLLRYAGRRDKRTEIYQILEKIS